MPGYKKIFSREQVELRARQRRAEEAAKEKIFRFYEDLIKRIKAADEAQQPQTQDGGGRD